MNTDFEYNDIVRIKDENGSFIYYIIDEDCGDEVTAFRADDEDEEIVSLPKDLIERVPSVFIDRDRVKQFARFEISFDELCGDIYSPGILACEPVYTLTFDDLDAALTNAGNMSENDFYHQWLVPVRSMFNAIDTGSQYDAYNDWEIRGIHGSRYHLFFTLLDISQQLTDKETTMAQISAEVKEKIRNLSLPVLQRAYTTSEKEDYVRFTGEDRILNTANDEELALYVRLTEELCEENNVTGLEAKAFSCYGGDRAYPCDWVMARDCFIKLTELSCNPFYANTLGYIYYYGRADDGKPDYDKAFRYFSIGAAGGVYESKYKLADMFRYGYSVKKNDETAYNLISSLYKENLRYICNGCFDCKFADIALRMGACFENGINVRQDYTVAYYFYLQADFAIRTRMIERDLYGDKSVAQAIKESIDRVLPESECSKKQKTVRTGSLDWLLFNAAEDGRRFEAKISRLKNGQYSIRLSAVKKADEKYAPKLFITVREAHFCGLVDHITVKTTSVDEFLINGMNFSGDKATVIFDKSDIVDFYLYDEPVMSLAADFVITFSDSRTEKKYRFASVEFAYREDTYDYLCEDESIVAGDTAIVMTGNGEAEVTVVKTFEKTADETALPIGIYKKIIRRA